MPVLSLHRLVFGLPRSFIGGARMARRGLGEAASCRVRSLTLLGVAAAVLVLSAGCSVEARKARYLKKADSLFDVG